MKKQYFVLDTINPETKLYYPVVCPVAVECDNVIKKLEHWAGSNKIIGTMACATKKRACEVVEAWREAHRRNGDYEF